MKTVQYEEVGYLIPSRFVDSEEHLFHSIAWDCLAKAGLTSYSNEKEQTYIYLYAYAIQLLCEEFHSLAFDESNDELELFDQEPLTAAAIVDLYRDLVADDESMTEERMEDLDEYHMLTDLVLSVQEKVEGAIFDQLGSTLTGALLYNAVTGIPKEDESDLFPVNERFHTKEALMDYSKKMGKLYPLYLPDYHGMQILNWISDHPDHVKH